VTRVLFWNIDGLNKDKLEKDGSLGYIVQVIVESDAAFFVVVEVDSSEKSDVERGILDESSGGHACAMLHSWLEGGSPQRAWSLVPPLRTDSKDPRNGESVAVFYRSDLYYFTGPNVYNGEYPPPFSQSIPKREIPKGSFRNPRKMENKCAAQASGFTGTPDTEWDGQRSPYLVTFADIKDLKRTVSIIAAHGPANTATATQYLEAKLPGVGEISSSLPPDETRLVVGDFNLDVLDEKKDPPISKAYEKLASPGQFRLLLSPIKIPEEWEEYVSYFTTRIKDKNVDYFSGAKGKNPSWYPGYRYTASAPNTRCLDNAYIAPSNTQANLTILNPIVGSPYVEFESPEGIPTGSAAFEKLCNVSGLKLDQKAPEKPKGKEGNKIEKSFRDNYAPFAKTSDHLPILIEF
jgi:hypothetical protein